MRIYNRFKMSCHKTLMIMFLIILFLFIQCINIIIPEDAIFEGQYFSLTDSSADYQLEVRLIENIQFLEHVYDWDTQQATKILIGYEISTGAINQSSDLGQSFDIVFEQDHVSWDKCFTTRANRHLLWESNDSLVWLFDKNWNIIKQIKNGDLPWHGSWSIGENDGVILYAEYGINIERLNVWRSLDGGENWDIVFWQFGKGSNQPQIQHFHTIQPDPYVSNTWYLSSGDDPTHCMVWKSSDNGTSWSDVTDPSPIGTSKQDVHRFTAINFDENYLYWGTDDELDGKAQFVRARRTEPLEIEIVDSLDNLIRAMIQTSFGYLFISEMKIHNNLGLRDFTIHMSNDSGECNEIYRFSNPGGIVTGFCYSKASKAANNNIFFCYHSGRLIFPGQPGIIQWQLSKN